MNTFTRRDMLKRGVGLLGGTALGALGCSALGAVAGEARAPRPNIICIVADDLGYGDVGFNGQGLIKTPGMDRLAREGMIFTEHYAGCPMCTPSRYCLMTGKHTGHMRMHESGAVLGKGEPTVAEMLKDAGYSTHFAGKWGLGGADMADDPHMNHTGWWPPGTGQLIPEQTDIIPSRKGFDTSLAYLSQAYAHWYYPQYLWRNGNREAIPENDSATYEERSVYSHDLFAREALGVIRSAQGAKPFYLQASFTIPHRECKAPPGPNPYGDREWPEPEKAYAAMVTYLDKTVSDILDAVDTNPAIRDNTLIILTSDNGPHAKDGHSPWFFDSTAGMRGTKFDLYEGGIRMPTAMRWRGVIEPGTRTDHLSAFWDFLPTCADLAGAKAPGDIDGLSFASLLTGKGTQTKHEYLYWEKGGGSGIARDGEKEQRLRQVVRRGKWKLGLRDDANAELYNLETDRAESQDVAAEHPEIVAELRRIASGFAGH